MHYRSDSISVIKLFQGTWATYLNFDIIGASLSEPHIDPDNSPHMYVCMYVCMYVLCI